VPRPHGAQSREQPPQKACHKLGHKSATLHTPKCLLLFISCYSSPHRCIIMEYAPDGDLAKVIKKYQMMHRPMGEDLAWKFFIQAGGFLFFYMVARCPRHCMRKQQSADHWSTARSALPPAGWRLPLSAAGGGLPAAVAPPHVGHHIAVALPTWATMLQWPLPTWVTMLQWPSRRGPPCCSGPSPRGSPCCSGLGCRSSHTRKRAQPRPLTLPLVAPYALPSAGAHVQVSCPGRQRAA